MIVGIVLFAFAMKKIMGHVSEELDSVAAFALCGGSALYLSASARLGMRKLARAASYPGGGYG
jgi:hypothetical protein